MLETFRFVQSLALNDFDWKMKMSSFGSHFSPRVEMDCSGLCKTKDFSLQSSGIDVRNCSELETNFLRGKRAFSRRSTVSLTTLVASSTVGKETSRSST